MPVGQDDWFPDNSEKARALEEHRRRAESPHPTSVDSNYFSDLDLLDWRAYSNCLGLDADLFYPERGASTREAKEVCRGCVVREDCLEYALSIGEKHGIWGGMSERERRRIRRQRRLAAEANRQK